MLLEQVSATPHPALRPFVAAVTGYRQEGLPPGVHRGVPSPYLTLVVTIDEPLLVSQHPDPQQPAETYDALIGGLHTRPALLPHSGRQCGVQLALTPLGARALLGVPAAALASWDADLSDVVGAPAVELTERVRSAADWPTRFAQLDAVLLRLVDPEVALAPEVAQAWLLTTQGHGRLRVDEVARRVGWSPRHLAERLRGEVGLTPKQAARVARFDHARRLLAARIASGRRADLAALAASCGFADQAHLTREWRALAGTAPSAWIAAELGFVQDTEAVAAAESCA